MDAEVLLDRCDEVLGAPGLRDHTWPWLVDDDGHPRAVAAYWPGARLAVVFVDPPAPRTLVAAVPVAAAYDIDLVGLPAATITAGDDDGLRRLLRMFLLSEERVALSALGEHGAALWARVADGESVVFGTTTSIFDDDEDLWEDDDEDWLGPPEEDDEELDGWEPPPAVELGWRTRPFALAALGAAALANRAFLDDRAELRSPAALQLLVAVAVAEADATDSPADDLAGLAARLGLHPAELRHHQQGLVRAGLVLAPPPYEDGTVDPPTLTEAGREVVERWLGRVAPLFGAWPPDHPAADDATG